MTHLSSKVMLAFVDKNVNKMNVLIQITGKHRFNYANVFYLLPYRGCREDRKNNQNITFEYK